MSKALMLSLALILLNVTALAERSRNLLVRLGEPGKYGNEYQPNVAMRKLLNDDLDSVDDVSVDDDFDDVDDVSDDLDSVEDVANIGKPPPVSPVVPDIDDSADDIVSLDDDDDDIESIESVDDAAVIQREQHSSSHSIVPSSSESADTLDMSAVFGGIIAFIMMVALGVMVACHCNRRFRGQHKMVNTEDLDLSDEEDEEQSVDIEGNVVELEDAMDDSVTSTLKA